MSTTSRERLAALVTLLLCLAALSQVPKMPAEAALFPELILGLAVILSLIWGASTFRFRVKEKTEAKEQRSTPFSENPRNLAAFVFCLAGYVWLIDILGYFTSTALFMVATSVTLGFRKPKALVAAVVGFVGFVYVIFVVVFQRPLPIEFFQAY